MASLSSIIDEIDIVNEKLERMRGLLAKARKDFSYVQTRAGEQRHAAVADDATEACPAIRHDYYTAFLSYQFCPYCGVRLLPQPSSRG